jgi:hypothetical protein
MTLEHVHLITILWSDRTWTDCLYILPNPETDLPNLRPRTDSGATPVDTIHRGPSSIGHEGIPFARNRLTDRPVIADDFTRAFVEALLFSESDESGDAFSKDYEPTDISSETLARICSDCYRFQSTYRHLWEDLPSRSDPTASPDAIAGHDFALTRNGHGAGFWDSPEYYGESAAETLTQAARKYGGLSLYVGDDGSIYHM